MQLERDTATREDLLGWKKIKPDLYFKERELMEEENTKVQKREAMTAEEKVGLGDEVP